MTILFGARTALSAGWPARNWKRWLPALLAASASVFRFAVVARIDYVADVTAAESKFLREAIKQGLRMQHRFLPEPVLARTGKGYLKSEGVGTLQKIKANLKKGNSGKRNGRAD